jgi:hypothetical protein
MYGGDVMQRAPASRAETICYHVEPGRDEGWDVIIEREHRVVSSTHCSDWHRVERICAALDRLPHDDDTPITGH